MKNLVSVPPHDPCRLLFWITIQLQCFRGNRSRPLWLELSEPWDSQSILSPSVSLSPCPPSVFLIAHSPSRHSDGGHVWSRAENGQSGSSRTHYYHCKASLHWLLYSHITLLTLSLSPIYRAVQQCRFFFSTVQSSVRDYNFLSSVRIYYFDILIFFCLASLYLCALSTKTVKMKLTLKSYQVFMNLTTGPNGQ